MNANQGAFSTLYAVTEDLNITASSNKYVYIGPDGKDEMNGFPPPAFVAPYVNDELVGKKLWEYVEKETGIKFSFE
ncbi:MAG: hypothetical protein COB24_03925 [Hyphomicrobiales bacterium]|nr:MAG: hypothetical protein COB24_03925 [Hyphomicrobiales bacterium]